MQNKFLSMSRAVSSVLCLALVCSGTGCDAIKKATEEKPAPTPTVAPVVTPEVIAPPMVQPETPTPVPVPEVKTPQKIIEEFLALPSKDKKDHRLKEVAGLPEGLEAIQKLDLTGSTVSDEGLTTLKAFPMLDELILTETPGITNAGMAAVAEATSLKTITIHRPNGIDDQGIKSLASLKGLRSLTITGSSVTDAIIPTLAGFEELEILDLSDSANFYGEALKGIKGGFRNLRELSVGGTKFGSYGFVYLNKLPKLEVLRANQCGLIGPALIGLKGCNQLRVLDISANSILDENVKTLVALKSLEELYLRYVKLTDNSLNSLKVMKHLKILDMTRTEVTEPAIQALKEKFLKDTKIVAFNREF